MGHLNRYGASLGGLLLAGAFVNAASAAETRGYVVSWFYMATNSQDGDCAGGPNPSADGMYRQILARLGKTPAEVDQLMVKFPSIPGGLIANRGRIDGKPVNVYQNPASEPDPQIHTIDAKYAFGFNLDGKGAASPNAFEDPETHEKGVNNQLYRALGCFITERGTPPERPTYPVIQWDMTRDQMPAWVIEISGIEEGKDSDVTVSIHRATGPIARNTIGDPQSDMTFQVDPNPRWQNLVHGKIHNGQLVTDRFEFDMVQDPFGVTEFDFKDARLRLTMNPDGTLKGILGGYQPWKPIYVSFGLAGATNEGNLGIDAPGIWYALRRLADAYPDPKTGQNTAISSAYVVEAVPAFVKHPSDNKTSDASPALRVKEAR